MAHRYVKRGALLPDVKCNITPASLALTFKIIALFNLCHEEKKVSLKRCAYVVPVWKNSQRGSLSYRYDKPLIHWHINDDSN